MKKIQREDGQATREKLLMCAGRLIAAKGYEATTSKEICELAGTNLAAVNYHFGSRDGLYEELLRVVHQHLMSLDAIQDIEASAAPPRAKIRRFLATFLHQTLIKPSWELRVWARELLHPSPLFEEIFTQNIVPKRDLMLRMFAEYTGLAADDVRLRGIVIGFMAPFAAAFLIHQESQYEVLYERELSLVTLVRSLEQFAFAGLDSFANPSKT
ncbi:TetR/AcrR family transcriptional regulator [uncultured Mitsuokella sp.]|uniref:TetR/AcrR family transcriptional regulator n=1 Tax=uncultured Mitsuokella sp. TaxID=453120 RepID=UPI00261658A9|nr:CerR family C-terminal domain-containing protein [uncultured Mitsuokella sp.]